jgi:hypothetical protein
VPENIHQSAETRTVSRRGQAVGHLGQHPGRGDDFAVQVPEDGYRLLVRFILMGEQGEEVEAVCKPGIHFLGVPWM